ncbi:HAD domain-containing protein [Paraburkholderia podalyriae]|uniref:Hydrolase n=2 Tax=Paraburkholderia podalyriae TaxID=1938811 RepID=A0ABR7PZ08_9BURK|nr:hydrolase [Paraburkholderia podalyriae]
MLETANCLVDESARRSVLFLDYDGVLHRGPSYRTRRGIVSSDPKIQLFEYASVLEEALRPYVNAEVVLSTSWVPTLGFNRARDALPISCLRARVVGATFHSRYHDAWAWPNIGRGVQVLRYVRVHRLRYWLAIDDHDDGFEGYDEHLVKCDEKLALGDSGTFEVLRSRLAEQFCEQSGASRLEPGQPSRSA